MSSLPQKKPAGATGATSSTSSGQSSKPSATPGAGPKSGIRTFKPGEILFNEKDAAESLYIIQKGQVRLYLPKGRGFVEIGILRTSEVIGEMAFFDEKARRRSCSAAAIVTTEVVEISFNAFAKTMQGLNPWFKTIVYTIADRLRKTNDKVKQLESNSVALGSGGKIADYKFFHNIDIIKILSLLYLTFKSHAEVKDGKAEVHQDKFRFYMLDVFNVKEIIWEELKIIFEQQGILEMKKDADGFPKIMVSNNFDQYRSLMVFFNTQRQLDDSKRLKISSRCEIFLKAMLDQLKGILVSDGFAVANISIILDDFKAKKIAVTEEDLADSHTAGFTGDIVVGSANVLTTKVAITKLEKAFPGIKLMNAIDKVNEKKAGHSSAS